MENEEDELDLSVIVNNNEYELNDDVLDYLERCAEASFDDNEYCAVWWEEYDNEFDGPDGNYPDSDVDASIGDPIMVIETSGHMRPWEKVVQPQEGQDDMSPEEKAELMDDQHDEEERLQEMPEEQPKVPTYAQAVPEPTNEQWGTTEAIIPTVNFYFRNIQHRINNPTYEDAKLSHKKWEHLLSAMECEILEEEVFSSDEAQRKPWDYTQKKGDNSQSNQVGSRYHL